MKPTEIDQIVQEVLIELAQWNPFIYCKAATDSAYIKFPHWGLGSLRIGDHKGKKKYTYRWRIRLDKPYDYFETGIHRGVSFVECGVGMIEVLIKEFNQQAEKRGINPD